MFVIYVIIILTYTRVLQAIFESFFPVYRAENMYKNIVMLKWPVMEGEKAEEIV